MILFDNSKIHKSNFFINWPKENRIKYLFLPRYSPDLNPVELVWAKMKHNIQSNECNSLNEKQEVCEEVWEEWNSNHSSSCLKNKI